MEIYGNIAETFLNFDKSSDGLMNCGRNFGLHAFLQLLEVFWPLNSLTDQSDEYL